MSNLIVLGFDNEADAFEMRAALARLQSQYLIEMEDAVVLDEDSALGGILKSLLGYNGNPSLLEVLAYAAYYLLMGLVLAVQRYVTRSLSGRARPAPQRAR